MKFLKRVLIGWLAVSLAAVAAAFTVKRAVPAFGDESDDSFSLVAVIGGRNFVSAAPHLVEGSALTVMGGIDLDLSQATLGPGAKLDLRAFMGGIDVSIPESWRVEVIASERMGDVVSELNTDSQNDEGPLLLIYASATMGGISISRSLES
ncbi:MAG: cell wall-active antibiotics response protein [Actinomycetia bacterium]|nr:cell wall-active antibiotics response protein [Actinomycetes bacterium]